MDARTRKALKGSIAKWEAIVAGTGEDRGADNCPLCELFLLSRGCRGCPVADRSGQPFCRGTPYTSFDVYALRVNGRVVDEESRRLAQAELDFLRSLLPAEEA